MSEERGWAGSGLLPLLDTAVSSRCRPVRSLVARGGAEAGGVFTDTDSDAGPAS